MSAIALELLCHSVPTQEHTEQAKRYPTEANAYQLLAQIGHGGSASVWQVCFYPRCYSLRGHWNGSLLPN